MTGRVVAAVSALVRTDRGRYLLVQRGNVIGRGLWSLPGGKLEFKETGFDGMQRELREETGLVTPLVNFPDRQPFHLSDIVVDEHGLQYTINCWFGRLKASTGEAQGEAQDRENGLMAPGEEGGEGDLYGLVAGSDALALGFFSSHEILELERRGEATVGVAGVVRTATERYQPTS